MRSHARLVTLTAVLVLLAAPFTAPLARAAAAPGSSAAAGTAVFVPVLSSDTWQALHWARANRSWPRLTSASFTLRRAGTASACR